MGVDRHSKLNSSEDGVEHGHMKLALMMSVAIISASLADLSILSIFCCNPHRKAELRLREYVREWLGWGHVPVVLMGVAVMDFDG